VLVHIDALSINFRYVLPDLRVYGYLDESR